MMLPARPNHGSRLRLAPAAPNEKPAAENEWATFFPVVVPTSQRGLLFRVIPDTQLKRVKFVQ